MPLPPHTVTRAVASLADESASVGWTMLVDALAERGVQVVEGRAPDGRWIEHGELTASVVGSHDDAALVDSLVRAALVRRADEQAARGVRERMELLSNASFEGIFAHVDGCIVDANARVAELLGFTHEEVLGRTPFELCVAPESRAEVLERMRSGQDGEYVITGIRKDGSRFRAELQAKQGRLGERPVRVVAFRDVTHRERTQQLLRESEQQLRDLAERAFDFVVLSKNLRVVDARGRMEEVVGWTLDDVLGRSLLDFVAEGAPDPEGNARLVGTFETLLRAKDGSVVPISITAVDSTLDGEPVRVAGLRDLRAAHAHQRERRRLEQQAQESERLHSLGVLAGGVAHDFNNLLVGILGNADLLLSRLDDDAERALAENIRIAGRSAADLTRQMLAYAGRRETGPRAPLDVGALINELRTLLSASLSRRANLKVDAAPGAVVLGERAGLSQVLMNLLTNASDALVDGVGTIDVRAQRVTALPEAWVDAQGAAPRAGDWVLVEVRDDGLGMDEATRRRVFEPFFTTKPEGHGLGLASCLGIVTAHGGRVLVESEPGVGSRFSIALPSHDAPSAALAERVVAAPSRGGSVLVIDDEPLVRHLLRRALEVDGFQVADAPGGAEGLALLAATRLDLVLLDLTMPGIDGAETLRRIRAGGSNVPVILTSGYARDTITSAIEPGSFQGFLAKPFSLADLSSAVRSALDR